VLHDEKTEGLYCSDSVNSFGWLPIRSVCQFV
jgi:hypothetical protein